MKYFQKVKRYGVRRLFVHAMIFFLCRVRFFWYKSFLSDNSPVLKRSKVLQATQFVGRGKIVVSDACLGVWPSPDLLSGFGYIEARSPEAMVEVKGSTIISNSFVIIADKGCIKIGERCRVGPNFFVSDSDFHGLAVKDRDNGSYQCQDVVIEDDVFIGDGVRILKGVRVGRGAVIASRSVVVSDVEMMAVYAGVPAKKIKNL